ncbi:hypothetical protein HMPREF9005_1332, partial [Actinomyces sp. oral taxon 178 str. F0338]
RPRVPPGSGAHRASPGSGARIPSPASPHVQAGRPHDGGDGGGRVGGPHARVAGARRLEGVPARAAPVLRRAHSSADPRRHTLST